MSLEGMPEPKTTVFIYKKRFITFVLLFAYALQHVLLTGVYDEATPEMYFDFTVRLPYGQRILVPMLARAVYWVFPLPIHDLFFFWEFLFTCFCWWAIHRLLLTHFKAEIALCLSWLFILLLPLLFIVNYRLTTEVLSNVYYAYDTPSLAFMILGFYFCMQRQWLWLYACIAVATINRESSILLVLLIPVMHWQEKNKLWFALLGAFFCYCLSRGLLLHFLADRPGMFMEWYLLNTKTTLFEYNMRWLLQRQYLFFYVFCFAGLPLFWFFLHDYIPPKFRPLRFLLVLYLIGLLMVGHASESRIYGEIFSLLYFPVCVAMSHWCMGHPPYPRAFGMWAFCQRYGVLFILMGVVLAFPLINRTILWLAPHS